MEKVRNPVFQVIYAGKNITNDITKYLISVEYVDNTANESDEITIKLADPDGVWRGPWYPSKGDQISLSIGYDDELLNCGIFTVDEIELQGPPDEVTIRGLAAGINSPLRTKKSRAYEKQSLRQIAQKVADQYGYTIEDSYEKTISTGANYDRERTELTKLTSTVANASNFNMLLQATYKIEIVAESIYKKGRKPQAAALREGNRDAADAYAKTAYRVFKDKDNSILHQAKVDLNKVIRSVIPQLVNNKSSVTKIYSVLDGIIVERVTQSRETDLAFLNRIAMNYGIMFSIRGTVMVFTSVYGIEKVDSIFTVDRTELMSYSLKDKATKTYKNAKISYLNPKNNQVVRADIASSDINTDVKYVTSDDTLEIRTKVENRQQAEELARARLHNSNTKTQEANITVPGNPMLCAGINMQLTGMGEMSGKWHVKKSAHKIDKGSGYTTDAEMKRIGAPVTAAEKASAKRKKDKTKNIG